MKEFDISETILWAIGWICFFGTICIVAGFLSSSCQKETEVKYKFITECTIATHDPYICQGREVVVRSR